MKVVTGVAVTILMVHVIRKYIMFGASTRQKHIRKHMAAAMMSQIRKDTVSL